MNKRRRYKAKARRRTAEAMRRGATLSFWTRRILYTIEDVLGAVADMPHIDEVARVKLASFPMTVSSPRLLGTISGVQA